MSPAEVSVAIPTFCREGVLTSTIEAILRQAPGELLVVDQTPRHESTVEAALARWHSARAIRWLRLTAPSIPRAMNVALRAASRRIVLFLDDDIIPRAGLVFAHAAAYVNDEVWAVAGQILQPGEEARAVDYAATMDVLGVSLKFPFYSTTRTWIRAGMAGNLSVLRERAILIGGFDENFVGSAYRFETEFCSRLIGIGGRILFEPDASIRHLKVAAGGTRTYGNHLTSASPAHGVGDYYFALRRGLRPQVLSYILRRPLREVRTRFHLRHPWWIPVKMVGELRAMLWALWLCARGPRYLTPPTCL